MFAKFKNWARQDSPSTRGKTAGGARYLDDLGVESLEDRKMLAGNVSVEVDNGDLEIRGENNTEQGVAIEATEVDGQFRIFGLAGTRVNGELTILVDGVTDDIDIQMRSGEKIVILTESEQASLRIEGDLDIKTSGASTDIILLDTVDVAGKTTIRTRGGDDAIILAGGEYGQEVNINTSAGDDVIRTLNNVHMQDELDIRTAGGNDYVMIGLSQVDDETNIRTGGGEDIIGLYDATMEEVNVIGGGRVDAFGEFGNSIVDKELRSVEETFDTGFSTMFMQAMAENDAFDRATSLFTFLVLGT